MHSVAANQVVGRRDAVELLSAAATASANAIVRNAMASERRLKHLRDAVWQPKDVGAPHAIREPVDPHRRIRRLESAIKRHLDEPLTLSEASDILGYEKTYCCRVFRSVTGKPFSHWNREIRVKAAKELLRSTRLPVTTICLSVGYSDVTTFERNFRKVEGTSPRAYRMRRDSMCFRESCK